MFFERAGSPSKIRISQQMSKIDHASGLGSGPARVRYLSDARPREECPVGPRFIFNGFCADPGTAEEHRCLR